MSYLMCILPTGYPTYWIFYIQFVFNLCEETISRTDEGQPRPKYIFNKCGTNIYFFTLQRFGPSPSLKFEIDLELYDQYIKSCHIIDKQHRAFSKYLI